MSAPAPQRIDGIDFWRGFALLTIFVDHAPPNLLAHITHHNFGFSDGAELFVFLSGISVALAYGRRFLAGEFVRSIRATYRRALTLYWVQILVSLVGIAFLVAAAYVLDSDDLTDDDDRAIMVDSPVRSIIAMLPLLHQLGFFNILPLYIVFLLVTPGFLALARIDRRLMLAVSFAIYVATRYFSLALPTWPLDSGWYFNPLAWQFVFVLGLFFGLRLDTVRPVLDKRLFILSIAVLLTGIFVLSNAFGFSPDLWDTVRDRIPHDKTSMSWIRLVHFVALAYAVYYSGLTGLLRTTPFFAPLALLGRHSLAVFAVGSLLTLVGEAIAETEIPDVLAQVIVILGGILVQYWVALYFEARVTRRKAAAALERKAPAATPAGEPSLQSASDGASLAT
jgi:hypothetical protein